MRLVIKKKNLPRLMIFALAFAISIPITVLSTNPASGHYALVATWVIGFTLIQREHYLAKLYFLLFGVFFVWPPIFMGDGDSLSVGHFFKSIELTTSETILMQIAIYAFIVTFSVSSNFSRSRLNVAESEFHGKRIANPNAFLGLLLFSFCVTIVFTLREINAVYQHGYDAYFTGNLGIQKSLPVFLIEMTFVSLCAIGLSRGKFLPLVLFCLYAFAISLSGQRMPGFLLMIITIAMARPNSLIIRNLPLLAVLGLGVAPPLFMTIQTLRVAGIDGLNFIDIWYFYTDFWVVISHSMDTLKAAIIADQLGEVSVNLAARLFGTLNVIFDRVFGIELGLNAEGFGAAFSSYFAPDLFFDRGVTFASSGIAESFYVAGVNGVIAYGFMAFWLCTYFQRKMDTRMPVGILALMIFAPRFLTGVRNELFGWLFEGMIYFAVAYPIFWMCRKVFLSSATKARNQRSMRNAPTPDPI